MTYRVGFLTSHPIQYQIPVFRVLSQIAGLELTVFFCEIPDAKQQGDGFNVSFQWDIPLLDGYQYKVLKNIARVPSVTMFSGCDTPEISEYIRKSSFDAFIVNGWNVKSCLQALWACRLAGVPCLVRGEANDIRPRSWWKRALQRQLVQQYAACLYIGKANKAFYLNRGVPEVRLFPALYCIDNTRFSLNSEATDKQLARKRFGLSSDSTVFLYCGKLIRKKHPMTLLTALLPLVSQSLPVEALVVGDGELRVACEAFVCQHNLPVRFSGFLNQAELVEAYSASDCLVLPSDHGETWGLVVNEAMACGRPAIVSDQVGCAADLITPGETGNVFRFDDQEQLSKVMLQVASHPEQLRQMGQTARVRVAGYSPAAAANGIWHAIQSTCETGFHRK